MANQFLGELECSLSQERIGCLAGGDVAKTLPLLQHCLIDVFDELDRMLEWTRAHRPKVLILDHQILTQSSSSEIAELKFIIRELDIHPLMLVNQVDEIHYWRRLGFYQLHFFIGSPGSDEFYEKITRLLAERMLLSTPLVVVVGGTSYLKGHLDRVLKYFGVRTSFLENTDEFVASLLAEGPEALVVADPVLYEQLRSYPWQEWKIELIQMSPHLGIGHEGGPLLEFSRKIVSAIFKRRQEKVKVCRDWYSGLLIYSAELPLLEKETEMAVIRQESFSIARFTLSDFDLIVEKYGEIFSTVLESNLGLFIQNNVRKSDIVSHGRHAGEFLLVLNRVSQQQALKIAERVMNQFKAEAAFEDAHSSDFEPQLTAEVVSFPQDFAEWSTLKAWLEHSQKIQGQMRSEKRLAL